ncbi:MAG: hypothetical protein J6A92_07695 [Lachnospiraceae bacterium]|nr:hypothetical protein [Lachnospiraceae bacterium]
MKLPDNDYQILQLKDEFYSAYNEIKYKEILKKQGRAYNCLLFQTHYDYFICIPYRTEISHKSAYHFRKSVRSRKHKSGLDYSKIIIVSDGNYMGNKDAVIDKDEFKETVEFFEKIKMEALKYVEDYVHHITGNKKLHPKEFERKYRYSTLRYFHKELGIRSC